MVEFPKSDIAYDPEAQALLVEQQQQGDELIVVGKHLRRKGAAREFNKDWFSIDSTDLFGDHCDRSLFDALGKDEKYVEVRAKWSDRIFTLGNAKFAVAAIIIAGGILYLSPRFDLEFFRRRNERFSILLDWLHR